ncbi:MAG: UPF0175 family protein [Melioribacteraceae bacterium]|nr:UPF0175 family protein [Saprospiraceae bacterium]MCF8394805.1 UPF0175 family protein [Melioribacteraceae bacterium]
METRLIIPESVIQAIRLPEDRMEDELLKELALSLYKQGILSFGKARELTKMGKYEFGKLLGVRKIVRHYGDEELEDDKSYASS